MVSFVRHPFTLPYQRGKANSIEVAHAFPRHALKWQERAHSKEANPAASGGGRQANSTQLSYFGGSGGRNPAMFARRRAASRAA